MKILAVSGSTRSASTNTALLRALKAIAPDNIAITVFDRVGDLPVFSPDLEGTNLPDSVRSFIKMIGDCDGLLVSSPEYVRSIPGGLKNAIDWLVSGDQIVDKPIALAHASHRGDEMLEALRTVLSTVSSGFNVTLFFRIALIKETPEAIHDILKVPANRLAAERFLNEFSTFCRQRKSDQPAFVITPD